MVVHAAHGKGGEGGGRTDKCTDSDLKLTFLSAGRQASRLCAVCACIDVCCELCELCAVRACFSVFPAFPAFIMYCNCGGTRLYLRSRSEIRDAHTHRYSCKLILISL